MKPLLSTAAFGLVPMPCDRATAVGRRPHTRIMPTDKFSTVRCVPDNGPSKRMATKDELAALQQELTQIESRAPSV